MTTSKKIKLCIVWDWFVDPPELFGDVQEKLQAWRMLGESGWNVSICVRSENWSFHTKPCSGVSYHSFTDYHTMQFFILEGGFDFILSWGSIDRPIHNLLLNIKEDLPSIGFQFAGGDHDGDQLALFDIIFTQNECDRKEFDFRRFHAVQLFGVDRSFWTPDIAQDKTLGVLYPAAFCAHKRNEVVAEKYGRFATLCGKWEDQSIVDACKSFGSTVLPRLDHTVLRQLYRSAQTCVIPAQLGSQRTLAEALSCDVAVSVDPANWKCAEILSGKIKLLDIPQMAEIYREEILACL